MKPFIIAIFVVLIGALVGRLFYGHVGAGSALMFPVAVAIVALWQGTRAAQFSICLSILAYWSLRAQQSATWLKLGEEEALLIFSAVCILLVIESLTARLRSSNALLKDQTEQLKRLNQQLNQALDQLTYASRQKSEFTAALSHDLKAPLIGCIRVLESVRDNDGQALSPEMIDQLIARNRQMLNMIRNILDLFKSDDGRLQPLFQQIEILQVVEASRAEIEYALLSREQSFSIEDDASSQAKVVSDPLLLTRVLVNALDNASRYSPQGGSIKVRVSIDGDDMKLGVFDSGPGIAPEIQAVLFSDYTQDKLSKASGGSGLGLYLSNKVMKTLGGSIRYMNCPDGMSHFEILIPTNGAQLDEPQEDERQSMPVPFH